MPKSAFPYQTSIRKSCKYHQISFEGGDNKIVVVNLLDNKLLEKNLREKNYSERVSRLLPAVSRFLDPDSSRVIQAANTQLLRGPG